MNTLTRAIKNGEGFTLIKLIASVVIIIIVIAIGFSVFTNQKKKDNDSDVKANMGSVVTQIETLLVNNPNANMIYSTSEGTIISITVGTSEPSKSTTTKVNLSSDGVNIVVNGGGSATENTVGTASGYHIWAWHENGKTYTEEHPLEYDNRIG